MLTLAMMEDGTSPETRRMLAFAKWATIAEGQTIINRLYRTRAV